MQMSSTQEVAPPELDPAAQSSLSLSPFRTNCIPLEYPAGHRDMPYGAITHWNSVPPIEVGRQKALRCLEAGDRAYW